MPAADYSVTSFGTRPRVGMSFAYDDFFGVDNNTELETPLSNAGGVDSPAVSPDETFLPPMMMPEPEIVPPEVTPEILVTAGRVLATLGTIGLGLVGLLIPSSAPLPEYMPAPEPLPEPKPKVDVDVIATGYRPPRTPTRPVRTTYPDDPPNWLDFTRPFLELPFYPFQFAMPYGNPLRQSPPARVSPRKPRIDTTTPDFEVVVRPRPSVRPADRPSPFASPSPFVTPWLAPIGDPGLFDVDTWSAPIPEPDPVTKPGTRARPTTTPSIFTTPFADPLEVPFALPEPWATPVPGPDVGSPTATPATPRDTSPGTTLLPTNDPLPFSPFDPVTDPREDPKRADPCNCVKVNEKPKKPKPRKPRAECWKGTYIEDSRSTRKTRRERVPCQ